MYDTKRHMHFSHKLILKRLQKILTLICLILNLIYSPFNLMASSSENPFHPGDYDKDRGIFFRPILSFLLPGFDQYLGHQVAYGLGYTGAAIGGLGFATLGSHQYSTSVKNKDFDELDSAGRKIVLGLKLYQTAGSFSAYHSFHSSVTTRRDDFSFMGKSETPWTLLSAPLNFQLIKRPTTWIPLGALAGTLAAALLLDSSSRSFDLGIGNVAFTGGLSYMAGTGEEALFRGWLMPMLHYGFDSGPLALTAQGVLFGAAHYSKEHNPYPIIQTLAGLYLGALVQQQNYSLEESIFLHTWWDVLALGVGILTKSKNITFQKQILNIVF